MVATALVCMALTIYTESRGEPYRGQVAVASVVLNRVDKNDSDVCTEVTRPGQFQWAKRKIRRGQSGYVVARKDIPSGVAWEQSLELADDMLSGDREVIPHIAYFHSRSVQPRWRLRRAFALGRHIFYS